MSHDGADDAARARSLDAPVDSAPATVPGGAHGDGVPPSAPSTEPRKPTLPPSPPTVPRPSSVRSPRAGASQPPPASPSQPAATRQPSVPAPGASGPAPVAHGFAPAVPPAPRAPQIEPYDVEATTDYDPFGDDAPTQDYDPRTRGIYASSATAAERPASPIAATASEPPAPRSPSGPPVVTFDDKTKPSGPPRAMPAPGGPPTSAASSPPSSQRRRSSRRAVPLPVEGAGPSAHARPASVPPPAQRAPSPPEIVEEVIKPMRILSIGSEPPSAARMPTPARARPAILDSQPQPPPEPRAIVPQVDGIGSPPVPHIPPSPQHDLEHGWTPMPAAVLDSQETVPIMPAVTDALLVESGFAPVAPPAQRAELGSRPDAELPPDMRRTQQIPRHDLAQIEQAILERESAPPESESEPDDFEVIEEPETPAPAAARQAPPPPPPKPTRPVTNPGTSATAHQAAVAPPPAAPQAAAPPAAAPQAPLGPPPPVRERAPSLPSLPDEGGVKKPRPWWEDLFGDDYLRTLDRLDAKHIKREVDFIEESLGLERGAVILDLACGEGQHAVDLASRGYSVVGFDLSLPMLARAADEAQDKNQKINFLHGDMREMAFEEMFDGIYCWSTSFGYFDDERNVEVLQRIHRALRVGGNFLLDVVNRDYVSPRAPSLVWFEGEGCTCMDDMHVDFFTSRLRVKRTAMFDDGHSRELDYSIRLYALHELGKMLHEAGFKVVEVTGHTAHPGVFFGAESPRMIILAERA